MQETRRAGSLALYLRLLAVAGVIVALDQLTKQVALDHLEEPRDLIDGVLTLRLTFNPGGAFGVLQGIPGFFLVASVVIVGLILFWARRLESPSWAIALGMILGGGLGNLCDRILRDTSGRVIDFVDLHVWPVFNLADASITLGVVAILVLSFRSDSERETSP